LTLALSEEFRFVDGEVLSLCFSFSDSKLLSEDFVKFCRSSYLESEKLHKLPILEN